MCCGCKDMFCLICSQCDLRDLKKALREAGLAEAVATLDPITVFGPTNKAFKSFSSGPTCGTLSEVLLYHVVNQKLKSCQLKNDTLYPTLREGKSVRVNVYERPIFRDVITVNGAEVVEADLKACNGVLHKIDQVLCPPAGNIVEIAQSVPDLSILVELVVAAGLVDALANPDANLTVFAPTNAAFTALLAETGLTLDQIKASPALAQVLLYHVLGQTVFSAALKSGLTWGIETLQGETVDICNKCDKIVVRDQLHRKSKVVQKDVLATNGVVHVVDRVLLPFSLV